MTTLKTLPYLSILTSMALVVGACKGGDGETSESSGSTSESTGTTEDETTSETTEASTSSSGSDTDTTTDTETDSDGTDTDPTEGGGDGTAYRFTTLKLVDPHPFWNGIPAIDLVNDSIQQAISDLSLNFMLVFSPSFNSQANNEAFQFTFGNCVGDLVNPDCGPLGEPISMVYTTIMDDGQDCLVPNDTHLNPQYDPPAYPEPDCFLASPAEGNLELDLGGGIVIPLTGVEAAGTFMSEPPVGFTPGIMRGFLSEEAAMNVMISDPINQPLSSLLKDEDKDMNGDQSGWWFYFNFNALGVNWTEGP